MPLGVALVPGLALICFRRVFWTGVFFRLIIIVHSIDTCLGRQAEKSRVSVLQRLIGTTTRIKLGDLCRDQGAAESAESRFIRSVWAQTTAT
ncbi:unnamed protein product [Fusarium graminearum]|uniref:Chromosome 1, complete genome n=2 Tax=Gibberella zeae TaxID=5518 RepID=A0A0E0RV57_GIBZE|nr:hypothetical protein FG05_30664 [Fusarium graminearum]CAF3438812.1 unnamed protein product [Fusarium graminearum]CAF3547982.1 unnamed protein product [Fusarium graminearum]CAG1988379.1 unnamed protein product [Fusarium graminearum]CAG2004860.1 unnamed protein product [Fusarium graminearum]